MFKFIIEKKAWFIGILAAICCVSALFFPSAVLMFTSGILLGVLTAYFMYCQYFDGEIKEKKAWFYPVISGVLTLFALMLTYHALEIYPFGNFTIATVDLYHQYLPMMSKLREMLLSGGNMFYSFDMGLGTNFLCMFAYYLASPLNVLLVLFPESMLTEAVLLITVIKVVLCSVTFAICIQYIFKKRHIAIPITSICYALSMFILAYYWNIMWLDCIIMLPLVIMCFEHLMRTRHLLPYTITLSLTLIFNYYIGAMICMFLIVYFIAYIFENGCNKEQIKSAFKSFASGSLFAGGMAMFLIIPTAVGLAQTSAGSGVNIPDMSKADFSIFDILARNLFAVSPSIRTGSPANTYCGLLSFFSIALFLLNPGIKTRRKISMSAMAVLLTASFTINGLNLIWHGFHAPNDIPSRFSFLYCFLICIICYELLINIKALTTRQVFSAAAIYAAFIIAAEKLLPDYSTVSIYGSLILITVYAAVLTLYKKGIMKRSAMYLLLIICVFIETFLNSDYVMAQLHKNECLTPRDKYLLSDTFNVSRTAIELLNQRYNLHSENDFFRCDLEGHLTSTDTALYKYPGVSYFSSSNYYSTTKFLRNIGYHTNGINSHSFNNSIVPADSVISLKYIVSGHKYDNDRYLALTDNAAYGKEERYIYENTQSLPLAFCASSDILEFNIANYEYNPLNAQSKLYSALLGETIELYNYYTPVKSVNNPSGCDMNGSSFYLSPNNEVLTYNFAFVPEKSNTYYVYVDCSGCKSINVLTPGSAYEISPNYLYTLNVGYLTPEDSLTVSISTGSVCSGNIYIASINGEVFEGAISALKLNPLEISSFSDSKITGKIYSDSQSVVFTSIPYDNGWKIVVDGKVSDTLNVSEAFTAFRIDAGEHTIEMRFCPRGFTAGCVISIISVLGLCSYCIYFNRKTKKEQQ